MSASKTLAFVLKTQDYRDTSMLATFFTRDFGKVRGIVKGIRDTRARFGSTLEPFSLDEILFYRRRRGGDLHLVTQVDCLDRFDAVRQDLERLSYASYFAELLNELTAIEDPAPAIFDLMRESLLFLSSGASPKRSTRIFEVKLLELLGLMPEVKACIVCGAENPQTPYFHPAWGGIRCADCQSKTPQFRSFASQTKRTEQSGGIGFRVSRGALNFIDHVRRSAMKDLHQVKVVREVGEELEKMLRRFVDYHLQNKLKTVTFIEKMGY